MNRQGVAVEVENGWRRHANEIRDVYFVRAKALGLIKIGVANHAAMRIVSLQTQSPDKLEVMGVVVCPRRGAMERVLHERFAHLREHGEWFKPGDDLLAYIAANAMTFAAAGRERVRLIAEPPAPPPPAADVPPEIAAYHAIVLEKALALASQKPKSKRARRRQIAG